MCKRRTNRVGGLQRGNRDKDPFRAHNRAGLVRHVDVDNGAHHPVRVIRLASSAIAVNPALLWLQL